MEQSLETRIGNRGREKDWEQGLGTEVGKKGQATKTWQQGLVKWTGNRDRKDR